jgi:hypothetical protein
MPERKKQARINVRVETGIGFDAFRELLRFGPKTCELDPGLIGRKCIAYKASQGNGVFVIELVQRIDAGS